MNRFASLVLPFALVCTLSIPAQADNDPRDAGPTMSTHDTILDILDTAVRRDQVRWLVGSYFGGMTLTEVDEHKGKVFVTGTFKTKGALGVLTRHFNAVLKSVGGSYSVQQCCWETFIGTPWCVQ